MGWWAEVSQRSGKHHAVDTRAVHGSDETVTGPVSTPIVHSSTFSFKDVAALEHERDLHAAGAYYQRYGHPTLRAC
jgi:O-acetylhomoserine/O-acetylserine sulfhydrylase-like pyridoxal-dependent enzyme